MKPPRNAVRELLSRNVRKLMEREGLSQVGVHTKTGAAQTAISKILRLASSTTIDTIDKIATRFGYKSYQLLLKYLPDKDSAKRLDKLVDLWPKLTKEEQEELIKKAKRH